MKSFTKQFSLVAGAALVMLNAALVWAAEPVMNVTQVADPTKGMTLWEVIKSGGAIVWVLFGLSLVAVTIIVYCFNIFRLEHFSPADFAARATERIDAHDFDGLKKLAKDKDNMIPKMVVIGLDRRAKGRTSVKEAMELYVESEVNKLWQLLGYLADLATIAPLVGLLGTVLGIIHAFHAFSHNTMALKLGTLAQGVSLALVATAGGLIVAIPIMLFYSYFKPRVQQLVTDIEFVSNDIQDNIIRHI